MGSSLVDVQLTPDGRLVVSEKSGRVSYVDIKGKQPVSIRDFEPAIIRTLPLESGELLVQHFNGRINLISQQDISCRLAYASGLKGLTEGVCLGESEISLTGHRDGVLKRWNTITGELEKKVVRHSGEIVTMCCHEPSGVLAAVGTDWRITVSNVADLELCSEAAVGLGVRSVVFTSDGKFLAGAPDAGNRGNLQEGTVDLWHVETMKAVNRFVGHTNWVTSIRFYRSNSRMATLALDGTLKTWDTDSGMCLQTLDLTSYAEGTAMQINEANNEIVVGHADGSISCWDLATGKQRTSQHLFESSIVGIVLPDHDGCLVVAVDNLPTVTFLDPESLKVIARLDAGTGNILDLRTDLAARRIQIFGDHGVFRIWPFRAVESARNAKINQRPTLQGKEYETTR